MRAFVRDLAVRASTPFSRRTPRRGPIGRGLRGVAVALTAVVATIAMMAAPASAANFSSGYNGSYEYWGSDLYSQQWGVDYKYVQGTNANCAPDASGNGWNCTASTPNVVTYAGYAQTLRSLVAFPYSMDTAIYRGSNSNPLAGGYLEEISNDCSATSGTWCSTPYGRDSASYVANAPLHTYSSNTGGYYSIRPLYRFEYWYTGCLCWAYSAYSPGNIGLSPAGTGSVALYLPTINTAYPSHPAPSISFGSPAGTTVHRPTPADVSQMVTMTATSGVGNNWRGRISVSCPGLSYGPDSLGGTTYRSGQQATSSAFTLPHQNGTCTETGNATDTSGTGTALAPTTTTTFNWIWNTAPQVPALNSPTLGQNFAPNTPINFSDTSTDAETDAYLSFVTVIDNSTSSVVKSFWTASSSSGSPATRTLSLGLPTGRYTWWALSKDQWGAQGAKSASQVFTVGNSVVPAGNSGGGAVEGSVHFTNPGGVPALGGCANTRFNVSGTSAAFVLNTVGTEYGGPVSITGSGASSPACETTATGGGTLNLSASGTNPANGAALSCPSLSGTFTRIATDVNVTLAGNCVVNGFAAGQVSFTARVEFAPTDPGGGVTASIINAAFAGGFTVQPR